MTSKSKCAHPACNCIPAYAEEYCSAPCADAKNLTELACQCDHRECRGETLKP
jgi:hypothetical protein